MDEKRKALILEAAEKMREIQEKQNALMNLASENGDRIWELYDQMVIDGCDKQTRRTVGYAASRCDALINEIYQDDQLSEICRKAGCIRGDLTRLAQEENADSMKPRRWWRLWDHRNRPNI